MHAFSYKRIHMVGIGGAGMSGLAHLLLSQRIAVSGSDRVANDATRSLEKRGAMITYGDDTSTLPSATQLVIFSAAIGNEHPSRKQAAALAIPEMKYAQALGALSSQRVCIAVSGTHGKTTTTSMTASVLVEAGRKPSWLIGGTPRSLPSASHWDSGSFMVVEACEYDHSFLNLHPAIAILHNVEPDHMEYFGSFENLTQAFADFLGRLGPKGVVFANWDDPVARTVAQQSRRRIISYGLEGTATYNAEVRDMRDGCATFSLQQGKQRRVITDISLGIPGTVNVRNALAAAAVGHWLGASGEQIAHALAGFRGVRRRFELVGNFQGAPVIDDYAHHPTALAAVIAAARAVYAQHKLCVVFQAHQYARLLRFFDAFRDALCGADEVVVCPTYAAREQGIVRGEHEERLATALRARDVDARSVADFDAATSQLQALAQSPRQASRVILVAGAGDITELAHRLAESSTSDLVGAAPAA